MAVSQWCFSKSFGELPDYSVYLQLTYPTSDNTNPFGPCLVSSNAIPDPQNIPLKCTLNGNTVQDGTTA